jgi:hypothetical protein
MLFRLGSQIYLFIYLFFQIMGGGVVWIICSEVHIWAIQQTSEELSGAGNWHVLLLHQLLKSVSEGCGTLLSK